MKNYLPFEHVLYINLDKHEDRAKQMESSIPEWFRGEVTHSRVPGVEIGEDFDENRVLIAFKNPSTGKNMTYGEIGCALAHINAWKQVIELNKPCLILEDDVLCRSHNILQDLRTLNTDALRSEGWELFYLGRQPLFGAAFEEQQVTSNPLIRKPGYSWLLSSYILTPDGAAKLLAPPFEDNLFVVDDYVPYMYGQGFDMEILNEKFAKYPKLYALALQAGKSWFGQRYTHGQERIDNSSTINSPEFFRKGKDPTQAQYVHLTVASDENNRGYKYLLASMDKNGWKYRANVFNGEWGGGDMKGTGGFHKLHLMNEALNNSNITDDVIVVFTDGYDTLMTDSPANVINRWYDHFDTDKVLFAGETIEWPHIEGFNSRVTPGPYPFLNSGCYIGKAGNIRELLKRTLMVFGEAELDYDDQHALHWMEKACPDLIEVDSQGRIFQCLGFDEARTAFRFDEVHAKLHNPKQWFPQILHGNGPGKELYYRIAHMHTDPSSWIGPKVL